MNGYNHYIRIDQSGTIVYGFSSAFEDSLDTDILIMEDGPRQFTEVWPEPLINEQGQYRYKWVDGQRVERSVEELNAELASRPPAPPTLEEQVNQLTATLGDYILGGL